MKTTNQILSEIRTVVVNSPINDLSGEIYLKTRPTDSELEDCVISLISGTTAKFLTSAALYIKIFYKDIQQLNSWFEDMANGHTKEILLQNLSKVLLTTEGYSFDVQSREVYTEPVMDEQKKEHYAILKMNFQITND